MLKAAVLLGLVASCSAFVALPTGQIRSAVSRSRYQRASLSLAATTRLTWRKFDCARKFTLGMVSSSQSSPSEVPAAEVAKGQTLPVTITANNFELTPALKEHTMNAVEAPFTKFGMMAVQRVDVHLSVIKHHQPAKRSRAEVTVIVDGHTLRRAEESDDMYAAVDMMSHSVRRALGKLKRKLAGSSHHTFVKDALNGEEYANLETRIVEEDETEVAAEEELEWPKVTKIKSFNLSKPMSLEDAVFALDFVDHDFYVFRNEESDQINVIYRRHGGRGVGLIQPEDE